MTVHSLDDLPLVLRVDDLARTLSISRSSAYDWCRQHPELCLRVGRSVRIPRHVVAELIGEHVEPSDGGAA
ncbi:MAG: helix-turn-helix domain-containing protein [Actinomycetota bacterium]